MSHGTIRRFTAPAENVVRCAKCVDVALHQPRSASRHQRALHSHEAVGAMCPRTFVCTANKGVGTSGAGHKSRSDGLEPRYLNTKRKAACVATSGLSLGRKRPWRAAITGLPLTLVKAMATSGSIERKG